MTRRRFPVGKTLLYVFMSLWALTTIYPFIWVILNSFKPRGLIRSDTFSLPIGDKFTLENYVTAFKRVDIGTAYVNSIVISGAVTVVVMVLAGLAAYAMVRYSFRLRVLCALRGGRGISHNRRICRSGRDRHRIAVCGICHTV